jgi:hypothetical protein
MSVAGRSSTWDGFIHGPRNLIKNILFLAKGLKKSSSQSLDEIENINTKIVTEDEIMLKLTNLEIKSVGAVSALFYGYLLSDYG